MNNISSDIERLLSKTNVSENVKQRDCSAREWSPDENPETVEVCDGMVHTVRMPDFPRAEVVRRCPAIVAGEVRARFANERQRLAGAIERLQRFGGEGFDGYDPNRHPSSAEALFAMRQFSCERPPSRNVFMLGPAGLGKTRLLLASHFALLEAGTNSHYVTSPELRSLFRLAGSFDENARREAEGKICSLRQSQAIHADDLGDVEGDERFRGAFAEGFKGLLDGTRAAWAFSSNCTYAEAAKHPDLGDKILSRMFEGAIVIRMGGSDRRLETAGKVPQ